MFLKELDEINDIVSARGTRHRVMQVRKTDHCLDVCSRYLELSPQESVPPLLLRKLLFYIFLVGLAVIFLNKPVCLFTLVCVITVVSLVSQRSQCYLPLECCTNW
jgi:hypothetical protein